MNTVRNQRGFGVVEVIILVVVLALIGAGGWYVWQAQSQKNQTMSPDTAQTGTQTPTTEQADADVFKIKEFGVEFDKKNDATPLYKITDYTFSGVSYKLVRLSTQQLVDKGVLSDGGKNPCTFNPTSPWSDSDYALVTVSAYNSQDDLLTVEKNNNSSLTAADIKPENGYITVGGIIFAVPLPGVVQGGSGPCIGDTDFVDTQRLSLTQSLTTLRASK